MRQVSNDSLDSEGRRLLAFELLGLVLVFAVMAVPHDFAHLVDVTHRIYWSGWPDQSRYFASARAFLQGDLAPVRHWYPLLYPLALTPFAWAPPFFAAFVVDLICYLATYAAFREVAARFEWPEAWRAPLFIATTLLIPDFGAVWGVPWTTTMSTALIWLALARTLRLTGEDRGLLSLGVLLGLIPLCRPADIAVAGLIGLVALTRLSRARFVQQVGWLALGALAVMLPYAALHLVIYGPTTTNYMKLSAAFGFDFAHLGWKAQTLLVDAGPFFPGDPSILERLPWLVVGLAGLIMAALRPERRFLALAAGLPATVYAVLMLAYADLVPTSLWTYELIHYFKWLLPLFGLFAVDFLRHCARAKSASAVVLSLCVAATFLRYSAVAAGPDEPARLLMFKAPKIDLINFIGARTVIVDREGPMRNLFDYHQVFDEAGRAYAEAWRRDFAGGERWIDSPSDLVWPQVDPVTRAYPPLVGSTGIAPVQRFRPQWSVGLPCWLLAPVCRREVLPLAPIEAYRAAP